MAAGKIAKEYDVVVVGAGNAGMCAALAARENGTRVLVLEAEPFDERGGNSRYTAGALRFVYNGVDDLLKLCDLSETEIATSDFGTYTTDKYYDDLRSLTEYRCNPDMAEPLIHKRQDTLLWLRGTRVNSSWVLTRGLVICAMVDGNWWGCHAVCWDYIAREFCVCAVVDYLQEHSYPCAIMVNADSVKFCDEGHDVRNYPYAKY